MAHRVSLSTLRASQHLIRIEASRPTRTSAEARKVVAASPQTPSAAKTKQVVDVPKASKQPSLPSRMFSTRNLCILAIGSGAIAAAASFAALTGKVGALGASQLVAAHAVAFLQPGVVITAFALKAGATVTMSAAMPLILPIASTVLVGGLGVVLVVFVAKKAFSGAGMVKDAVLALPKKLVEQIPGGKAMIAYFSSEGKTPTEAEVEKVLLAQYQAQREKAVEENKDADVLLPRPGLKVVAEEEKEVVAEEEKEVVAEEEKEVAAEEKKEVAASFEERGIVTRENSSCQKQRSEESSFSPPFGTHQPGEMARRARTTESLELSAQAAEAEPTSGSSAMSTVAFLTSAVFGFTAIGFALKTGAEFGDIISEM